MSHGDGFFENGPRDQLDANPSFEELSIDISDFLQEETASVGCYGAWLDWLDTLSTTDRYAAELEGSGCPGLGDGPRVFITEGTPGKRPRTVTKPQDAPKAPCDTKLLQFTDAQERDDPCLPGVGRCGGDPCVDPRDCDVDDDSLKEADGRVNFGEVFGFGDFTREERDMFVGGFAQLQLHSDLGADPLLRRRSIVTPQFSAAWG